MNARNRGPLAPRRSLFRNTEHGHLKLARAIRDAVPALERIGAIDPLSGRILSRLHVRSVVPCWLLAVTRARWNELAPVNLAAAIRSGGIQIDASKGSRDRWAPLALAPVAVAWVHHGLELPTVIESYDTTVRHIYAAQRAASIVCPPGHNSATHVFRHLWASWRASRGDSIRTIADGLGHFHTASTLHYVHDSAELLAP